MNHTSTDWHDLSRVAQLAGMHRLSVRRYWLEAVETGALDLPPAPLGFLDPEHAAMLAEYCRSRRQPKKERKRRC